MNTGVKVLLAVLIVALALDLTLIVLQRMQSNPKSESEGTSAGSYTAGASDTAASSSLIFGNTGTSATVSQGNAGTTYSDDYSEAELEALALAEESGD